jgi:RHS repeat-associated protein
VRDPQGTPLAETDANRNIIATFDYTPYGSVALGSPPSGPGYTGHVNDPETSLIYMQARYFDPVTGRFLSTDPISLLDSDFFSFNRYAYAFNNPITYYDPDGQAPAGPSSCGTDNKTTPSDPGCGGRKNQMHSSASGFGQAAIGFVKGVEDETKGWPVIGADAGAPSVTPSNKTQAKYATLGTVFVRASVMAATDGEGDGGGGFEPGGVRETDDWVDLAPAERRTHILDGDPNNIGSGGHRWGTGRPNKSEFPKSWSDDKIMHMVSDVATDPKSLRLPNSHGRGTIVRGTREGVDIVVVIKHDQILAAWPENVPRNP